MKYGTKVVVGNGSGTFCAWFLEWIDEVHMKCVNKFGGICIVDQADIEQVFV